VTADPVAVALGNLLSDLTSPLSQRAYKDDWARYCLWLGLEGVEVIAARPKQVSAYIAHLKAKKFAKATTGRALSVIREVYGALVRDEIIESNPAREIKNQKLSKDPTTPHLSEEQTEQLLNLPAETWKERRARICIFLLFGLGWRRAEVARLRVEDFEGRVDNRTVTGIFKGNKTVTVGVPEWLQAELESWRAFAGIESGAILPRSHNDKSPISGDITYKIVKGAAARAGLPLEEVTPHALRRTNLTLAGERGVSLKVRQLSVGHSSQATTERYDHARDAAKNAPGQVFADMIKEKK
jgi:integrase/recombinase XerD